MKHGYDAASLTSLAKKTCFVIPGHDSALILAASARSRMLPDALFGLAGPLGRLSGCSWSTPGTPQDTPEALLERSSAPRAVLRELRG